MLNNYFEDWPTDEAAASATDEDFFEDEEDDREGTQSQLIPPDALWPKMTARVRMLPHATLVCA